MTTGALAWQSTAPLFFAAEVTVFTPGSTTLQVTQGYGTRARGTISQTETAFQSTETIRVSDLGYRTAPADGPVQVYPPYLDTAFAINRTIPLDSANGATSETWGSVTLLDPGQVFDTIAVSSNTDSQNVKIFAGRKTPATDGRGIYLDPRYSALTPLFTGLSQNWILSETSVTVPLRDPAYWLAQPLQTNVFGGTGGYDGVSSLAGTPKPKTRGGVVRNVTPVLVDPVAQIYQYTDGAGTISTLYEGGDGTNILRGGDVPDLYAGGGTAPGYYRTCNAKGCFQLGSPPASGRIITVDVSGAFPVAGAITSAIEIAAALITEDGGLPAAYVDLASFSALDAAIGHPAGWYFDPKSNTTTLQAVTLFLASVSCRLIANRGGLLRPLLLQAPSAYGGASVEFTPANALSLTRSSLPATLDPPVGALRMAYLHNFTVQTSNLSPAVAAFTVATYLSQSDQYASVSNAATLAAYRHPNTLQPFTSALTEYLGALAVANIVIGLWGVRRRLYTVTLPLALGLASDLGDTVRLQWPVEDLAGGVAGLIVGEATRSSDNTMTFQVLV